MRRFRPISAGDWARTCFADARGGRSGGPDFGRLPRPVNAARGAHSDAERVEKCLDRHAPGGETGRERSGHRAGPKTGRSGRCRRSQGRRGRFQEECGRLDRRRQSCGRKRQRCDPVPPEGTPRSRRTGSERALLHAGRSFALGRAVGAHPAGIGSDQHEQRRAGCAGQVAKARRPQFVQNGCPERGAETARRAQKAKGPRLAADAHGRYRSRQFEGNGFAQGAEASRHARDGSLSRKCLFAAGSRASGTFRRQFRRHGPAEDRQGHPTQGIAARRLDRHRCRPGCLGKPQSSRSVAPPPDANRRRRIGPPERSLPHEDAHAAGHACG